MRKTEDFPVKVINFFQTYSFKFICFSVLCEKIGRELEELLLYYQVC
jgi:hypothetical protein